MLLKAVPGNSAMGEACSSTPGCSVGTSTELIVAHSCSGSCRTTGMNKDMSCVGTCELERISEGILECLVVHSVARRDVPCPAGGAEGTPWCMDEETWGYRRKTGLPQCVSPHTGMNMVRSTWGCSAWSSSQRTPWRLWKHTARMTHTSPHWGCGTA